MEPRNDGASKKSGRREFLELAGKGTFGAALAAAVFGGPLRDLYARVKYPEPDHKPLEGACVEALTDDEKKVAAIVDTVVPGKDVDPDGVPGARESCALNLIYDEFYPFVQVLPSLLLLVDTKASSLYSRTFMECTFKERTKVLQEAEDTLPLIRLAYRFIRSTFYASTYNMVGAAHLNWPGPNLGYTDHPDFTFGAPLSRELTRDGNLP